MRALYHLGAAVLTMFLLWACDESDPLRTTPPEADAPETEIVFDDEWPRVSVPQGDGSVDVFGFADGDTIAQGSTVTILARGYESGSGMEGLRLQGRIRGALDEGSRRHDFATFYGELDDGLLLLEVGPIAYTVSVRSVDEEGVPDETPAELRFVGGFQPRIVSTSPRGGDALMLRQPQEGVWEQSLDYESAGASRFWDGSELVLEDPCAGIAPGELADCRTDFPRFDGELFRFEARVEGRVHPSEVATTSIQAWSYSQRTANDPENEIADALESIDLSFFVTTATPNLLSVELIELFVPEQFWASSEAFEPGGEHAAVGRWLARRLGDATFEVQARTSAHGDRWTLSEAQSVDIGKAGRRSPVREIHWTLHLGLGAASDVEPTRRWPDFPIEDYGL